MRPAFKVFLSHRYKSPETNLFFFNLVAERAVLQFEVDEGVEFRPLEGGVVQGLPTNVTRLERMIRDTDAFVGFYPLSLAPTEVPTQAQLLHESRYFRLELDLAIRSGKPALMLYDQRYKSLLDGPPSFFRSSFDAQEILPGQETPSAGAWKRTFSDFAAHVEAFTALSVIRGARAKSTSVGVLLPPRDPKGGGYDAAEVGVVEDALRARGYEPVRLLWPPSLGSALLIKASSYDFMVVDVGDNPASTAAIAFLHGRFVPSVRLRRVVSVDAEPSELERSLYGSITVGYPKDIVRWQSVEELEAGIRSRLHVLEVPAERINIRAEAEAYFARSAQRPLNVFLSYSGRDEQFGKRISAALSRRFRKVFDYKDGKSIRPGEPWLKEIFEELAGASVAIPLISDEYFASDNCEHEAREIIARRDNQRLHVIPVKLKSNITVPVWFGDIQSERLFATDGDDEALAQRIVNLVDERAKKAVAPTGRVPT
jgi:hypothetical protein